MKSAPGHEPSAPSGRDAAEETQIQRGTQKLDSECGIKVELAMILVACVDAEMSSSGVLIAAVVMQSVDF